MHWLRYGRVLSGPRQIVKYIMSSLYPLVVRIWPLPSVLSIPETLDLLNATEHSIVRFGDGEFLYVCDKLNLPFQSYDPELAKKMMQMLHYEHPHILVGLPSGYHSLNGLSPKGKRFWRSQISWIYPRLRKHLSLSKTYANASITRIYAEYADKSHCKDWFERFMKLWYRRDIVLIEGEKSRVGVGNDLFAGARSVKRILGPMHHAWGSYEALLAEARKVPKDTLLLLSLGPCAKVLGHTLALEGYRVLDIGNLDIEYEWYRRDAPGKVKIPGKYTSEAKGGRVVEDSEDPIYLSQIIAHIQHS